MYFEARILAREAANEIMLERQGKRAIDEDLGTIGTIIASSLSLVFFGGLVAAHFYDLPELLETIVNETVKVLPFPSIFAGVFALLFGALLFRIREVIGHPAYAPCEILVGCIAAGYSIKHPDLSGVIAFIAGLRIIIDGIKRVSTLREVRLKLTNKKASPNS